MSSYELISLTIAFGALAACLGTLVITYLMYKKM